MNAIPFRLTLLACCALLAACSTSSERTFQQARQMLADGRSEEALANLEQLVQSDTANAEYRKYWLRQREIATDRLLRNAATQAANQRFDEAQASYEAVLRIQRDHPRAVLGLKALERSRLHAAQLDDAAAAFQKGDAEQARFLARQVLLEAPRDARARKQLAELDAARNRQDLAPVAMSSAMNKLVNLEFRSAPLLSIFDMLGQSTGINFVFDSDVKLDARATILAHDTPLIDALGVLLSGNGLARRVLNDNSILIYPATPNKMKRLEALNVKTFYLNNIDAKVASGLIKTIARTRDIHVDEKMNSVTIRDTPAAIAVAEKLIAANDIADAEVMLEVEVMEVAREKMNDLGLQFPDTIGLALPLSSDGTQLSLNGLKGVGLRDMPLRVADPALVLRMKSTDGDTNTLANPRIRVKNKEKAKIHIGDRVPVITTTTNPTSGSIAESVNYLDVGLKLDVEPQVYDDSEVGIKLSLEVSNIVKEVASKSGLLTYQIGTRTTNTALRLKDGETQILAGLIKRDEIESAQRVPGLGQLPMLGRLFSSQRSQHSKTEIVLLITPHVLRGRELPAAEVSEFASGTEEDVGGDLLRLPKRDARVALPPAGSAPLAAPAAAPEPAVAQPAAGAQQ